MNNYFHHTLTENLDYFSLSVDADSMQCFDRHLFSDCSHSVPKSVQENEVHNYSLDE